MDNRNKLITNPGAGDRSHKNHTNKKRFTLTDADIERKENNYDKYGECGCPICGKPVKNTFKNMLRMLPDGSLVDDPNELIKVEPCAELGYWRVGDTCYRRFKREAVEMTLEELNAIAAE